MRASQVRVPKARCCATGLLTLAVAGAVSAQQPVTRAQAIDAALRRGARLAVARADAAVASAQLLTARAFQNPLLTASYSKAIPRYHLSMELPIDVGGIRTARIGSAEAARQSAEYRFQFERAAVVLDADTTYTRALAALARARLSNRNAQDSDSLRVMTVVRRDAGDASEMDVELATVSAGQQINLAASDSLSVISALLDLQAVMGLPAGRVTIALADSLVIPPVDPLIQDTIIAAANVWDAFVADAAHVAPVAGVSAPLAPPTHVPLQIAAAQRSLASAELAVRLQQRSVWIAPSITAGIETGDPTGAEPGLLPTVGVIVPLPLLSRNRGPISQAVAERERARAQLTLATIASRTQITRALRERAIALSKLDRDRRLLASANRVATMSLTAYREGASALANVLQAQRTAREVLGQYVDDLTSAWIATASLRAFTLTAEPR
jgi:cobalt-zinc-cadmium efflux system outer membrane protein